MAIYLNFKFFPLGLCSSCLLFFLFYVGGEPCFCNLIVFVFGGIFEDFVGLFNFWSKVVI